jgi:iron complex transport system substrate-binding protein
MVKKTSLFLIMFAVLLSACASGTTASNGVSSQKTIKVKDALDRRVTVPTPAQRIISLAPSNTEILFTLGVGDRVIGRDTFSDYPESAQDVQDVGNFFDNWDTETILTLEPDLILVTELATPEQIQSLENLDLTVFAVPNPTTLEEMYENIELIARFTGTEQAADALIADLKDRVAAVEEKISPLEDRPVLFYELDGTDPSAPWTSGPGTFLDQLISMAGGQNAGSDLYDQWAQINLEELIIQDPEIILLGDALYGGVTPEDVASRPGWESLSAVQNERIYPFDDNLVSRPGPRLVDGLEALAEFLHPELFE